jgi:tRNA-Thr(GGU) m(6)t(6)A37 methyltransferase TsaA
MKTEIRFIGKIRSALQKVEECPLQENENAPEALIEIFPGFIEGIQDIQAHSEILLLTWLHLVDRSAMKTQPRNNLQSALSGVFSTRSPDRPNPIGLHRVKVLSILNDRLIKVSGLEVIDQTPLIDIKPVWNE